MAKQEQRTENVDGTEVAINTKKGFKGDPVVMPATKRRSSTGASQSYNRQGFVKGIVALLASKLAGLADAENHGLASKLPRSMPARCSTFFSPPLKPRGLIK